MQKLVTIYIELFDEGVPCRRPTQAIDLENGTFKVLPTPNYDPENEVWEFLPGSIVRCKIRKDSEGEYLYAVEQA
jgi:hypothetical protein